jgi:hypothetical protein
MYPMMGRIKKAKAVSMLKKLDDFVECAPLYTVLNVVAMSVLQIFVDVMCEKTQRHYAKMNI